MIDNVSVFKNYVAIDFSNAVPICFVNVFSTYIELITEEDKTIIIPFTIEER